jgi:hypothetical protein
MTFRVDINTGTAAIPTWVAVTEFVRSWSFNRGRDRFLAGFAAGELSVTFDNRLRTFDPLNGLSSVQSAIVPRGQVRLFSNYEFVPAPTRTNLVLNPSLETNDTFWTSHDGTSIQRKGGWSGQFSAATQTEFLEPPVPQFMAVETAALAANTDYRVSFYYLQRTKDVLPFDVVMRYDTNEVFLATFTPSSTWQRGSIKFTTPSSVGTTQRVRFNFVEGAPSFVSFKGISPMAIDAVLVEETTVAKSYFDGSFTDSDTENFEWTGTPHNSTSTLDFDIESGYQFVGYITDWDLQYDLSGDNVATLTAADGFTLLANQTVPDATQPLERTGTRIERLLDAGTIQWPVERRNISQGNRFVTTDTTDSNNALEYFQQITLTELGELFVAKNGDLTYRDSTVNNPSPADVVLAFADDGSGIKYESIQVEYGSEQLTNRFTVTWVGGEVQDNNEASQLQYGVTEDSAETLAQNLIDAASLAGFYVNQFGEPLYRITQLSMNLRTLSDTDQDDVLNLELGDIVTVTFTPNNVGSPIFQYAKVAQISQSGNPGLDYFLTFGLETFTTLPLVLGDATYGKIGDDYVLGF